MQFQLDAFRIVKDELTNLIADYPIWLCDDDGREITDFIGLDEHAKKLVFVHAKMGGRDKSGTGFYVKNLQDVARGALSINRASLTPGNLFSTLLKFQ